ncbi:hypothetical protein EJ05DRAFT_497593 [Pseudovirgaria hyperparasitica]|uniref:Uncharacterized protein n=1 Tax=Pseudovirgaria hyperparasitica TaxID=470096 RepID=A0A6A6WGE5_9PEZI|nr:uncharacterized protein EJ05DRAFT_497593 [Pseudovirgaria hyperparasitica]KAF2761026.1 hypothetical protein EJ05DRAFT_497593 [Pseudovirgaria hyperparasitica]
MVSVHPDRLARAENGHKRRQRKGLIPQRSSQRVAESRSVSASLPAALLSSGSSSTESDDTAENDEATDDDNSSTIKDDTDDTDDDDNDDDHNGLEDEELRINALSRMSKGFGRGKGKGLGKGPGIRATTLAGSSVDSELSSPLKRKRRESNVSISSVLEDGSEPSEYPRRKIMKKLNHTHEGLLAYQETDTIMDDSDDAANLSDDDYNGVDDISDSDENDKEIELAEEEAMMDTNLFHRSSIDSANDDVFNTAFNQSLMQEFIERGNMSFADAAISAAADRRKYSDSSAKRVRFLDEVKVEDFDDSSSSSSATDDFDSVFPDLFVDQSAIPEKYLDDPASDSDNSYWDFNEDDRSLSHLQYSPADEEDSEAGSSGYETDGDTTDEEEPIMPPPSMTLSQNPILSRPTSAAGSQVASPSPFRRTPSHSARKGPRVGKFEVDPCKVAAYADATGQRLAFEAPQLPNKASFLMLAGSSSSSMVNSSPRTSMLPPPLDESDFSESQIGADIFIPNPLQDVPNLNNGAFGPLGAFMPGPNGEFSDEQTDMLIQAGLNHEDDDEGTMNKFFNLGGDSDDESDIPHFSSTPAPLGRNESSLDTPVAEKGQEEKIWDHLGNLGGSIGAFRNNQHRSRDLAQLPADPDLRASTAKPIRSGKSAETPITPARRRRSSMNPRARPTLDSSPLLDRPGAAISKRAPLRGSRMGAFAQMR